MLMSLCTETMCLVVVESLVNLQIVSLHKRGIKIEEGAKGHIFVESFESMFLWKGHN